MCLVFLLSDMKQENTKYFNHFSNIHKGSCAYTDPNQLCWSLSESAGSDWPQFFQKSAQWSLVSKITAPPYSRPLHKKGTVLYIKFPLSPVFKSSLGYILYLMQHKHCIHIFILQFLRNRDKIKGCTCSLQMQIIFAYFPSAIFLNPWMKTPQEGRLSCRFKKCLHFSQLELASICPCVLACKPNEATSATVDN